MKQGVNRLVMNMIVHMPEWAKRLARKMPWLRSAFSKAVKPLMPDELTIVDLMGEDMLGYRLQIKLYSEKSMITGDYGPSTDPIMKSLVHEGMTIYDIGAHIGYFALWFALRVGSNGQVVSFEPDPRTLKQIKTNVAINNVTNIQVVAAAASNQGGTAKLKRGPITFDSHVVRDGDEGGDIEIQLITIDEFVDAGNKAPDMMKIDVEGHEMEVLQGAEKTLAAARPVVYCEIHGIEEGRMVCDFLSARKYKYAISDGVGHLDERPSDFAVEWTYLIAWPQESPIDIPLLKNLETSS